MREVETLVYQRLIADTSSPSGIVTLLGSTTRILHGFQVQVPSAPGLTFYTISEAKGMVPRLSRDIFVNFSIYAQNYLDIADRLNRLFDNHRHNLSLISGGAMQLGGVSSVFDFEGPDGYDESLDVQKKDLRFRFFVVPKARDPI
jgi:hypothetical protein